MANRLTPNRLGQVVWSALAVCLGALTLWWIVDHKRGLRWAVHVVRHRFPDLGHLSPHALSAWLADNTRPTPLLLDARSAEEFVVSHLPSARRIDPSSDLETLRALVADGRPIVVYCSAGYRGARTARQLREAGAKEVANLEGGIFAWANKGFPVVRNGQEVQEVHPFRRIFSRMLRPDRRSG